MPFDLAQIVRARAAEHRSLYDRYVNPQMGRVVRALGFDRTWVRAEGAVLVDADGHEYLDTLSGWGVFNLGRNHPTVVKAIADLLALERANLVQMDTPLLAGLLAEALAARAPADLGQAHFTNSGTEASEAALKFARYATGRTRVVYCANGYHGLTYGALSAMGHEYFRRGFGPLLAGFTDVPFGDLEALERQLAARDVAAFITEPIQGGGVHLPPDGYLAEARRLCERYGTLLVLDEIQTGLGRTGRLFALEHYGVVPDMLLLAKALSGGLVPVGAVLLRPDVYRRVFHTMERCVVNSATFAENDLAMAAGLATLDAIDEERLVERAARAGARLAAGLERLKAESEFVKDVRGLGLMVAVEFGEPRSRRLKLGWRSLRAMREGLFAQMVVMALFERHRILGQSAGSASEVVKLIPPLVVTDAQIDHLVASLGSVLRDAARFPGGLWDIGVRLARLAAAS
ncbi:MAG TPA: aspartate aminotransferase family protein [Thermodesulfobacteriota bacterium]